MNWCTSSWPCTLLYFSCTTFDSAVVHTFLIFGGKQTSRKWKKKNKRLTLLPQLFLNASKTSSFFFPSLRLVVAPLYPSTRFLHLRPRPFFFFSLRMKRLKLVNHRKHKWCWCVGCIPDACSATHCSSIFPLLYSPYRRQLSSLRLRKGPRRSVFLSYWIVEIEKKNGPCYFSFLYSSSTCKQISQIRALRWWPWGSSVFTDLEMAMNNFLPTNLPYSFFTHQPTKAATS